VTDQTLRSDRVEQLRAEARYRRERLDLYRAKVYGPRLTSPARLAELERDYELAAERLKAAIARARDD
jgi:hypothetical protein